MSLSGTLLATILLLPQSPGGFVANYLLEARGLLEKDQLPQARAAVERALERDDRSLLAWELLAAVAQKQNDVDGAVHALHSWLDAGDARTTDKPSVKQRKAVVDQLLALDPEALSWQGLQKQYVLGLLDLGKQYQGRKDWLGALEVYQQIHQIAPDSAEALAAVRQVRATGGREVAVEDVYAGGDPTGGLSEEQIAERDKSHADWKSAWTEKTENYRFKTDAGFLVLKTSQIAMEQMNVFYRRFFHFMEDGGKTPQIEIRIFKNRDEYLSLGQNPQPWSGGHFIGDAVETYVGGATGKESIRDMYQTLFHEAAHQFVSMTGPMVPGWLNEAYASFFEGCVILSNGTVKWNQAPPGRLFPLAQRMEKGWMAPGETAGPDASGQWTEPEKAPTFRTVVSSGYQWGPPWYAPTWGVVYFLYNLRHTDGRPVYRAALHQYYLSFKRGQPKDPVAHFEAVVLKTSPLSPAQGIDQLDPIWRAWILELRDRATGKSQPGDQLVQFANACMERGDKAMALEFLEEARELRPDDVELLWRVAGLLEELKQKPQAAARYRQFLRGMELLGRTADPRTGEAKKKITNLDPLVLKAREMKARLGEKGLALARGYETRSLPTMALWIARAMSASFSIPEALEYFTALAAKTGKSLARWRVAYNEKDLSGWSAIEDASYQAYGRLLRASVAAQGETMVTRELCCDVTFDSDFSLSAEMRIEGSGEGQFRGRLMGLCFGRKGADDHHAVLLHPKGFLDISSKRGGSWVVHDHRSLPVGAEWHTLRIDVTGANLDVYLDGLYVRSLQFAEPAAVRGAFGLICGPGEATFRNVRLLARDPFDPSARIERELAMARVMADASKRTPGTFTGFIPPELEKLEWQQGEATTLEKLRARPVLLAFWSMEQEKLIATADYLVHLCTRGKAAGLQVLVVCDGGTDPARLKEWLKGHPLPGLRIAIDAEGAVLEAYFVKAGFFGLPRMLLLDTAGKVVFEGDPGLKQGRGWNAEDGPTYVDAALDKLLGG